MKTTDITNRHTNTVNYPQQVPAKATPETMRQLFMHKTVFLLGMILFFSFTGFTQGTFPRDGNESLAMRLHDMYVNSQKNLSEWRAGLPQALKNSRQFPNLPGMAQDVDIYSKMLTDIEREVARIKQIETFWNKVRTVPPDAPASFANRYGPLSESSKPSSTPGVDQIKAAILNFPFDLTKKTAEQSSGTTSLTLELPGYWGHLSYTISGAKLEKPSGGDRGKVAGRDYTGKLSGSELTVTGKAVSDNTSSGAGSMDYYELVVTITAGKATKSYSYIAPKGEKLNKSFSLSVPIDKTATSGSFRIHLLEQNANYGPHGWVVSGYLTK